MVGGTGPGRWQTSVTYDAVVDVARHPSWVRAAVAAYPTRTGSSSRRQRLRRRRDPGRQPATLRCVEPIDEDVDLKENPEAYGPMKVACEQVVLDGAASAMVIRPGLIIGPEDPTGRFSYWPRRLAAAARCWPPGTR